MPLTGTQNSFDARQTLEAGGKSYTYYSLPRAAENGLNDIGGDIGRLPFSLKVLLENMLRYEDGSTVTADDIRAFGAWLKQRKSTREIAYRPARVLMQDFTGVPAVVDLAAMRDAIGQLGGDPKKINPLVPVDLVIDHSVTIDYFGTPDAFRQNVEREFERNRERYEFLRWGRDRLRQFTGRPAGHRHLPPGQSGISGADRVVGRREWRDPCLSGHLRRHRQPHDDGERSCGARLGRRRHRGRSGDARAARLDADTRSDRLQTERHPEGRRDGDRSGAHGYADAALPRRGRQVRRVLRRRARSPDPRRPGDDFEHGAGIRRDLRLLPDRRRSPALSRIYRPGSGTGPAGRGLCQSPGHVARRQYARPGIHRHARTRPRRCRAVHRRPEAAAGPDRAHQRQQRIRGAGIPAARTGSRGRGLDPGRRRRRHRVDHKLYQHVESRGAGGGRVARPQGAGEGPATPALGENQLRARLPGGQRLFRAAGLQADLDALGFNLVGYGCTTCIGIRGRCRSRSTTRSRPAT